MSFSNKRGLCLENINTAEARIAAADAKEKAKPPRGPFGTGREAEILNMFTRSAPLLAQGKLSDEQKSELDVAVTDYTQEEKIEVSDPVTGKKSYRTQKKRLPPHVITAYQLVEDLFHITQVVHRLHLENPESSRWKHQRNFRNSSCWYTRRVERAYLSLSTPKRQRTLWNQRYLVAGPISAIQAAPVVRIFGQIDPKIDEARTFFDSARRSLIKALAANPRFPVSEMQAIEKEIDIAPAFFDNPNSLGSRLDWY
jgi:hypothetical protein